jgi:hypothetical protein
MAVTIRMCKCEVRELHKGEQLCPACAEAKAAFWKKALRLLGPSLCRLFYSWFRGAPSNQAYERPCKTMHHTPNTFITSSPKWLMTFTAIRPVSGRGKGREMSR